MVVVRTRVKPSPTFLRVLIAACLLDPRGLVIAVSGRRRRNLKGGDPVCGTGAGYGGAYGSRTPSSLLSRLKSPVSTPGTYGAVVQWVYSVVPYMPCEVGG